MCVKQRIRSKNYKKYVYCTKRKQKISFDICDECRYKEHRKVKPMRTNSKIRNKSNKLAKLEKNRFSIITDNLEKCYICKAKKEDLHEIFGGRNRRKSMQYGLVVPVCRKCHEMISKDKTLNQKLHKVGQKVFKKHYKSENFIQVFGRNYLDN